MGKSYEFKERYRSRMPVSAQEWANSGISGSGKQIDVTAAYAGMTLAEVEDRLRSITDHEEAVIFDKNMNVIAAYSGGDSSVALPNELKNKDGIIITHNHPMGDTGYGATFSPSDVTWFASSRAAEIRAVAGGQGEFVYSLQVRGTKSSANTKYAKTQLKLWAAKTVRDTISVEKGGTGKLQSDYNSAYSRFRSSGMSSSAASHAAWQVATGNIDRSLTDFVGKTGRGAIYVAKNKRYNVNR